MKNVFTFIFISVFAIGCSQNNDFITDSEKVIIENRTLPQYKKVENNSSLKVVLTDGEVGAIQLKAPEKLIPYIKIKVEDDKIIINLDKNNHHVLKHQPTVFVPVDNNLNEVILKGSGDVKMNNLLDLQRLECLVVGSGDIEINVNANFLSLVVQGSGDIESKGTAKELIAKVIGSGDVEAKKTKVNQADLLVQGSGDIESYVIEKVKARVIGSGDIEIKGNPPIKDCDVKGSGDIKF